MFLRIKRSIYIYNTVWFNFQTYIYIYIYLFELLFRLNIDSNSCDRENINNDRLSDEYIIDKNNNVVVVACHLEIYVE